MKIRNFQKEIIAKHAGFGLLSKALIGALGRDAATFLCALMDKMDFLEKQNHLRGDERFHYPDKWLSSDWDISAYAIRELRKRLLEQGLIEYEYKPRSNKYWYRLNLEAIENEVLRSDDDEFADDFDKNRGSEIETPTSEIETPTSEIETPTSEIEAGDSEIEVLQQHYTSTLHTTLHLNTSKEQHLDLNSNCSLRSQTSLDTSRDLTAGGGHAVAAISLPQNLGDGSTPTQLYEAKQDSPQPTQLAEEQPPSGASRPVGLSDTGSAQSRAEAEFDMEKFIMAELKDHFADLKSNQTNP